MNITNIPAPDAIILHANYAVFSPGKIIPARKVQSRMLLWCKNGRGLVTVNGETLPFSPGTFLFAPWNHIIQYHADKKYPFLLAGIHIVPVLKERGDVAYSIFHTEENASPEYRKRDDIDIPGFSGVFSGTFFRASALEALAEYIVAWFQSYPREEFMARNLAIALIYELIKAKKTKTAFPDKIPHDLRNILIFVEKNIENNIEISSLSMLANCSRSTIFRLFRKHLNCTPVHWILKRKMDKAGDLLKKTTLRIGEIGEKISIGDPYYFSKLFKKFTGMTARDYRNEHLFIK